MNTASDRAPDRHPRTLLLVDDEEAILSSLKRLFRRDGYQVLTATSGQQGLEVLASQPVGVILSDQRMPGMTGIEFMREARRRHPHTLRMTLSGYTDLETIIEAVNEGAVFKFLTKPWDDDRLRGHVAQAFEQSELAAENRRLGESLRQANTELALANQRLERLAREESERREAMQHAAGVARDALDGLPIAVFGIDDEGMLVYVNGQAVHQWPDWSSALGSELEPSMQQLLAALEQPAPMAVEQGRCTTIGDRLARVWVRRLTGRAQPLGTLMLVQQVQDDAPAKEENTA